MPIFDPSSINKLAESLDQWKRTNLRDSLARMPESQPEFVTASSEPIQRLYTPADLAEMDYLADLNLPGEFPYTRGIHPTMHRSRLWTMRMFAGFGTAEETNQRFKYLLGSGTNRACRLPFDLPTLMGYDSDAPEALGEFGKCGVAVSSLKDMEILLDGIPLDQGVDQHDDQFAGSGHLGDVYRRSRETRCATGPIARHNPERYPQGIYCSKRIHLSAGAFDAPGDRYDRIRYPSPCRSGIPSASPVTTSAKPVPLRHRSWRLRWRMAWNMSVGRLERGLDVDDFAPRLSFFFNAHNDFFEEIAKYRAARRIWSREMRDTFGAKEPRSWLMRFHTQTAGVSLTAQQPENNIVRVAIQALAAVLGGTQSLHTNSMDEALALAIRRCRDRCPAHPANHRRRIRRHQHHRSAGRVLLYRGANQPARSPGLCTISPRLKSLAACFRRSKRALCRAKYRMLLTATSRKSIATNAELSG